MLCERFQHQAHPGILLSSNRPRLSSCEFSYPDYISVSLGLNEIWTTVSLDEQFHQSAIFLRFLVYSLSQRLLPRPPLPSESSHHSIFHHDISPLYPNMHESYSFTPNGPLSPKTGDCEMETVNCQVK